MDLLPGRRWVLERARLAAGSDGDDGGGDGAPK
jgi:hypothetical protein